MTGFTACLSSSTNVDFTCGGAHRRSGAAPPHRGGAASAREAPDDDHLHHPHDFGAVEVTGTVDLPGDESAEVAVVWPAEGDDGTPLVVVRVPEWPMTPKAAREL